MAQLFKDMQWPEKEITRQIREYLDKIGVYHWKVFQTLGSKKGVADILGIWKGGKFLAIEVKTERGMLSEEQRDFLDQISARDGIAFVARSVDDVMEKLG
jgi:Holliday junction resolvase